MKLTTLLLIATFLQVSASTFAQRITLSEKNAPITKVLTKIKSQTGYDFIFTGSLLKNTKPVTIEVQNAELNDVLTKIFDGQELDYTIEDKSVVVSIKKPSLMERFINTLSAIEVKGKIVDPEGRPLVGASVKIKRTGQQRMTDAMGEFSFTRVNENEILVVSYVGFQTREIPVKPDLGSIVLTAALSKLDEVQVIAYGTTSRRLSTGNISSVKAEDIEKQPVNNPLLALQGRVPGLVIEQTSGLPGAGLTVRIQGLNSLSNGNNPFYVIDGVPYSSESLPSLSAGSPLNGGSPLAFIDPSTIESIDVLKDADATAIYGSRAANGAILITTKKGKAGPASVDLTIREGLGAVANMQKLMNTEQYLEMRREAYKNDGIAIPNIVTDPTNTAYDVNGFWDQTRSTDWQKVLLGGTARYRDYQASVGGGNAQSQFLFTMGYHNEKSVFPADLGDRKVSALFNINHRSANNKFRFQASGTYLSDLNQSTSTDLTSVALTLAPNAPSLFLPNGSLNWEPSPTGNTSWVGGGSQPLSYLLRTYDARTYNMIAGSFISYALAKGLEIKANIGYNNLSGTENSKTPISTWAPESRASTTNSAQNSNKSLITWSIEPQLHYKKQLARGSLDALFGATFQQSSRDFLSIAASGFSNESQMDNWMAATTVTINNAQRIENKYSAIFGRLGYINQERYLFNVTARRDGTSRFGADNRFANFYSLAAGWIFSQEKLIKNHVKFLSFGKLRISYGTTGSDQVGDYAYVSLYSNVNTPVPYQGATSINPAGHSNPFLQWEQTNKLNLGLDLGILNDRIILSANFVQNRSSNQLVSTPLPSFTGFTLVKQNLPATVQNTSVELSLQVQPMVSKRLLWNINVNATIPKNKLVDFPDLENSALSYRNALVIGESINISKAYQYAGINPATGLYQFRTAQGTLVSSPAAGDNFVVLDLLPKWYGGIQNSITAGDFQFDFSFQYINQLGKNPVLGNTPGAPLRNQPAEYLDRWKDQNIPGTYQKFTTLSSVSSGILQSYINSDATVMDASYLRLKNASISWSMPRAWSGKLKLQKLQVFFTGQNLMTITNHKFNGDPETRSRTSLPPLRVITSGLRASL